MIRMKSQLSFLLVIMLIAFTMFSCGKEYEIDSEPQSSIEEASLRGDEFKNQDGIAYEFQNAVYKKN